MKINLKKICNYEITFNKKHVNIFFLLSLLYLLCPYFIFAIGTYKIPVCLVTLISMTIMFAFIVKDSLQNDFGQWSIKTRELLFVIVIALTITIYTGTGAIVGAQAGDWVRTNAILSDLFNNDWPVMFDGDSKFLKSYTAYFMFPVAIGKLFQSYRLCEIAMMIYTFIGLFFGFIWIVYVLRDSILKSILFLLCFSGMDAIGYWITTASLFQPNQHLDQWANISEMKGYHIANYQSMGTALRYSIMHYIPAFIIVFLILYFVKQQNYRFLIILACLLVYWTPLMAVGLFPFAVFLIIYEKFDIRKFISVQGILAIVFLLCPLSLCYLAVNSDDHSAFVFRGLSWLKDNYILVILFILLEFGVYFFLIFKSEMELLNIDKWLLHIAFWTMALLLFVDYGACRDLSMRASVVPWLLMFYYWVKSFERIKGKYKLIAYGVLSIGALSCSTEYVSIIKGAEYHTTECSRALLDTNTLEGWFAKEQYIANVDAPFYKFFCKKDSSCIPIDSELIYGEQVSAYDFTDFKYRNGVDINNNCVLMPFSSIPGGDTKVFVKIIDLNNRVLKGKLVKKDLSFCELTVFDAGEINSLAYPNQFSVYTYEPKATQLADLSDSNWENGIYKGANCLLLPFDENVFLCLQNSMVILDCEKEVYKIAFVECDEAWIRVTLDDNNIDTSKFMYPNQIYYIN